MSKNENKLQRVTRRNIRCLFIVYVTTFLTKNIQIHHWLQQNLNSDNKTNINCEADTRYNYINNVFGGNINVGHVTPQLMFGIY